MKAQFKSVKQVCVLLSWCAIAIAMVGCKTDEAKSAGFVDKSDMHNNAEVPFQKIWVKPGFDKSRYTKMYIAPVNTAYMLKMTEWQEGVRRAEIEQDVAKMAVYTETAVKTAYQNDPTHRWQIVESRPTDSDALIAEIALIEVVPSKVLLNALGYAPYGVGLGLTAVRTVSKDVSTVAIEVRLVDASTKEVVATMTDRRAEQMAVVSVRGLTWYSHAEAIISSWAKDFVLVMNRKPSEVIKAPAPFTLKPW